MLRTNEDAIVQQPTEAETTLFASMIHKKYPMDGLKLILQRPGNKRQQDNFYNGWTHET